MKKVFLMMMAFCAMLSMMTSCGNGNAPKGYKTSDGGLYYRFHETNEGDLPKVGDLVELTLSCTVNDSTVIIPESNNIIQLSEPSFATDFMEGIAMMHKGDSASFIVNIDSTFKHVFRVPELPEEFNSKDVMRFEVKVNDFYPESDYTKKMVEGVKKNNPDETERANAELQKYFEENHIKVTPTATGLCYVIREEGNGVMPKKGDNVKVHYVGKLLDGTVFDSSIERGEPIQIPIGMGYVIPGWDEGIMMMSKGEKGVLYIPYYLGYGDRGAGTEIPPFSNLIFEVELIDF